MYPAKLTAHQEAIKRALERLPLLKKGTVLEGRYIVTQDSPAHGAINVKDTTTGKFVTVAVFADTLLWDKVQELLSAIVAGQQVVNLPSYAVKKQEKRTRSTRVC